MENKIKHYRTTLMINGIVALIFGALAIFLPNTTIKTVAIYFGILLLLGGILGIVTSAKNMKNEKPYLSAMINSIVSAVVGLFIIFNTYRSLEIFAIIIGIWALVIGAVQLFIALKLLEPGNYKKLLISNGIITLIFGFLLFLNPFGSVIAFTYLIGIMAIIFGSLMLFFAISIRSVE